MGFFDRVVDMMQGGVEVATAPLGFVYDVARSEAEELLDGDIFPDFSFIDAMTAAAVARGGQIADGLEPTIGAIPEPVRGATKRGTGLLVATGGEVLDAFEFAGTEFIREPLSTALIAGSLTSSDTYGGDFFDLFDPQTWKDAHGLAQTTSVGQAFSYAVFTHDILDQEEINNFAGTNLFFITSGTTDFFMRVFLDVDVLLGKSLTATKPFRGKEAFGAFTAVKAPQISENLLTKAPDKLVAKLMGRGRTAGGAAADASPELLNRANQILQARFNRLPESVRKFIGSDVFQQADVDKLIKAGVPEEEVVAAAGRGINVSTDAFMGDALRAPNRRRFLDNLPLLGSPQFASFANDIAAIKERTDSLDEATGEIRRIFFRNHSEGGLVSSLMAQAPDRGSLEVVTRVLLGDTRAVRGLDDTLREGGELRMRLEQVLQDHMLVRSQPRLHEWLAGSLEDGTLDLDQLRNSPLVGFDPTDNFHLLNYEEGIEGINRVVEDTLNELIETTRTLHAASALRTLPNLTLSNKVRQGWTSTQLYQKSILVKPLRMLTDFKAHNSIHVVDPGADTQVARMLRESRADASDIARFRGKFVNARNEAEKVAVAEEAVDFATERIMKAEGLDKDEMEVIKKYVSKKREEMRDYQKRASSQPRFDADGLDVVVQADGELLNVPLRASEVKHVVVLPDFTGIRKEAARLGRVKHGWDRARDAGALIGEAALDGKPLSAVAQTILAGKKTFDAATAVPRFKLAKPVHKVTNALDTVMSYWKIGALLRPAWTFKVLVDEQLRQAATFGTLAVFLEDSHRLRNYFASLAQDPQIGKLLGTLDESGKVNTPIGKILGKNSKAKMRGMIGGAVAGTALGGPIGTVVGGGVGAALLNRMANLEKFAPNMSITRHSVRAAFGSQVENAEVYESAVRASAHIDKLINPYRTMFTEYMKRRSDSYVTHMWRVGAGDDVVENLKYINEWTYLASRHWRHEPITRMFLEGKTQQEAVDWMQGTVEGLEYALRVPARRGAEDLWVGSVYEQMWRYTGGDAPQAADVRKALLADNLTDETIEEYHKILSMIPEEARNPIHGSEYLDATARSDVANLMTTVDGVIEMAFKALGGFATDDLSRMPTFQRFYAAEMSRLVAPYGADDISVAQIQRWENQARRFALVETRDLLYDLAERSEFAEMTRILLPFFNAYQEVLSRWAGIAIENPLFASRAIKAYELIPKSLGIEYTDDQGNEFVQFRLPSFAKDLLGHGFLKNAIDSQGSVRFDKSALNLAAQGTPGFGPFAQIVVSEAVREYPSLESSMEFIIPFGPVEPFEAMIPSSIRRVYELSKGDQSRTYANNRNRILITHLNEIATGVRPEVDFSDPVQAEKFLAQVEKEAQSFAKFRIFTTFIAPYTPVFDSPFKVYEDIYRAIRANDFDRMDALLAGLPDDVDEDEIAAAARRLYEENDSDADATFLDLFGQELFAITTSFTRSTNGVPPTVFGSDQETKFDELITRHPEWGSVIVGQVGSETAKFSRAVYDRQLREGDRERKSAAEILEDPQVRLGWQEYSRRMDLIEFERIRRGLPNLQVSDARDLAMMKRVAIDSLSVQFPLWFDEFQQTDRGRWNRIMEGAIALAEDEDLRQREEIRMLNDYLGSRSTMIQILQLREAAGGASSLTASSNEDLAFLWESLVGVMLERSTAFTDLYHRRLEREPISASSLVA